jgi:hypothetical protein
VFKKDYLRNITPEQIEIRVHGRLRLRNRQNFTDEDMKDIITEKFPISVKKNEDGEFELKYSYNKERNNIVVIVRPSNTSQKSIRLVTTYNE